MRSYWESFVALFFPNVCGYCQRPLVSQEELLCLHCVSDLPRTFYHEQAINPFLKELQQTIRLEDAHAYLKFEQSGMVQHLLHALKYKGKKSVGRTLGRWLAEQIGSNLSEKPDILVPVPLHPTRQSQRGFNQAELIADGISEVWGIPVMPTILRRTRYSKTQTKKGRINRWLDSKGLYEIHKRKNVNGLRVMLVDDVVTTGATIASAVDALWEGGAAAVSVACIASGKKVF